MGLVRLDSQRLCLFQFHCPKWSTNINKQTKIHNMQTDLFNNISPTDANNVLPIVAMDGFREVSKDEFYNIIGPLDVTLSALGNYPYTTEFKLRHGRLIGKAVDSYKGEYFWPVVTRYYISCNWG